MKKCKRIIFLASFLMLPMLMPVCATDNADVSININGLDNSSNSLKILFLLTLVAIVPSLLIMMSGFTRIVMHFLKYFEKF